MKPKSLWKLLKTIFMKWVEDDPFQSAAALSYYTLFSLAPLLIISIAVAGFVFGREAAQNQIVSTIQGLIGQESAQAVQAMIQNASNQPKTGMISTLLGGIILLFGAGGVVGQLQTSLNTIWGVTAQSDSGLRDFIRKRFVSFAMVLGVGFLLLVSLTVSAFISGLTQFIGSRFEGIATIAHLLDILISFGFVTLLFAMIYKFLPDVEIQWQDVLDRRCAHLNSVYDRKIPHWALFRQQWHHVHIWRRWFLDHGHIMGLLLIIDIFVRRRVHGSLCQHLRIRSGSNGKCRKRLHCKLPQSANRASGEATSLEPLMSQAHYSERFIQVRHVPIRLGDATSLRRQCTGARQRRDANYPGWIRKRRVTTWSTILPQKVPTKRSTIEKHGGCPISFSVTSGEQKA